MVAYNVPGKRNYPAILKVPGASSRAVIVFHNEPASKQLSLTRKQGIISPTPQEDESINRLLKVLKVKE